MKSSQGLAVVLILALRHVEGLVNPRHGTRSRPFVRKWIPERAGLPRVILTDLFLSFSSATHAVPRGARNSGRTAPMALHEHFSNVGPKRKSLFSISLKLPADLIASGCTTGARAVSSGGEERRSGLLVARWVHI